MKLLARIAGWRWALVIGFAVGVAVGYWWPSLPGCGRQRVSPEPQTEHLTIDIGNLGKATLELPGQSEIAHWRQQGVPNPMLCDWIASDFNQQIAFHEREFDSSRFLRLMYSPQRLRIRNLDEHRSRREDVMIQLVGTNVFHQWNQPRLLRALDLEELLLTAVESSSLYTICYRYSRGLPNDSGGGQDSSAPAGKVVSRSYRRALRNLLGEERYYQFMPALNWDADLLIYRNRRPDWIPRTTQQALYRIDEWELEEIEKVPVPTAPAPPALPQDGLGGFTVDASRVVPLPRISPTSTRAERLHEIHTLAALRREAIMKSVPAPPSAR